MPVVINEFEVVDVPQQEHQAAAAPEGAGDRPPPLPDAADLRRLLAQQQEAQLRLWAH